MATVIDALFVELGLDTRKFTTGQRAAVDEYKRTQRAFREQTKETDDVARRNSETMASAGKKILGFVAAFAGLRQIQRWVDEITKADAATGRMAHNVETSTKDFQAWVNAVQRVGGSGQAAANTLRTLSQQFHKFSITGEGGDFIKWMQALGVTPADPETGKLKQFNELLLETSAALQKLSPAQRVTFGEGFGLDEGFINLLGLGPNKVRELLSRQGELGAATDEQIKKANELQQAWMDLGQAVQSLGRDIVEGFIEPLTKAITTATYFLSWWRSEKGKAKANAQGDAQHVKLRRGIGTPEEADELLRSIFGGTGGVFVPLRDSLTGGSGRTGADDGSRGSSAIRLRVKPGAGVENTQAGTQALAQTLQRDVPGLKRFTAGNDAFHRGRGGKHPQGLALDFTLDDKSKSPEVAEQIRAKLKAMGINATVIDEYSRPSPFSTGGHIHVQFNSDADAARFNGAQGAIQATNAAAGANLGGGLGGGASSRSVQIDTLNVNTQATDAEGIGRAIGGAIDRNVASEANSGQDG